MANFHVSLEYRDWEGGLRVGCAILEGLMPGEAPAAALAWLESSHPYHFRAETWKALKSERVVPGAAAWGTRWRGWDDQHHVLRVVPVALPGRLRCRRRPSHLQ